MAYCRTIKKDGFVRLPTPKPLRGITCPYCPQLVNIKEIFNK
jgi:hypothetical protein